MKRSAFTMIELVFVIVILGILAAIAIPKLAATRTDAVISVGKADVASIRSSIVSERQKWLVKGTSSYIPLGDSNISINGSDRKQINKDGLFGGLLMYGKASEDKDGKWYSADDTLGVYSYKIQGTAVTFTYTVTDGKFDCVTSAAGKAGTLCKKLVN